MNQPQKIDQFSLQAISAFSQFKIPQKMKLKNAQNFFVVLFFIFVNSNSALIYEIQGRLECLISNNSQNAFGKEVRPETKAKIQLWEADLNAEFPFGLVIDGDDYLGETFTDENGQFSLMADENLTEFFGLADLEPYLLIWHKCPTMGMGKLGNASKCQILTRFHLSAMPERKENIGIRLGEPKHLETWESCE